MPSPSSAMSTYDAGPSKTISMSTAVAFAVTLLSTMSARAATKS
jgi:hypothetical protein